MRRLRPSGYPTGLSALILVPLLVAGCLDAPEPLGEPPAVAEEPPVAAWAGPPFEASPCEVHYLEFTVEKDRLEPHLPDHLEVRGSWARVILRLFECGELLLGEAVQRDGWFATTYVLVAGNETDPRQAYVLETFAGWNRLGSWFGAVGVPHGNGTVVVESTPEGAEGQMSAGDVSYSFQALPRDPGESTVQPTQWLLLAGPEGAGRMKFSMAGPMQQSLVSGMAFQASGGVLGDLVGTGPGTYQYAQVDVRYERL